MGYYLGECQFHALKWTVAPVQVTPSHLKKADISTCVSFGGPGEKS